MTYDPRTYWEQRPQREGPAYVGHRDHSTTSHNRQTELFGDAIALAFLGREPFESLLDFGCGSGRFTTLLASMAGEYKGVDISISGLQLGADVSPLPDNAERIWLGMDRLPFAPSRFDAAAAITVLQHIPERDWDQHWAPEIRRVLRPGAKLLVIDDPAGTAEHMFPRLPSDVAEALDCEICCGGAAVLPSNHWAALMSRRLLD